MMPTTATTAPTGYAAILAALEGAPTPVQCPGEPPPAEWARVCEVLHGYDVDQLSAEELPESFPPPPDGERWLMPDLAARLYHTTALVQAKPIRTMRLTDEITRELTAELNGRGLLIAGQRVVVEPAPMLALATVVCPACLARVDGDPEPGDTVSFSGCPDCTGRRNLLELLEGEE